MFDKFIIQNNVNWEKCIGMCTDIKPRPLKAIFFQKVCTDMGAKHMPSYTTAVHDGTVLSRTFELRQIIHTYLQ